jgi:GT2 family glycosyltransferase
MIRIPSGHSEWVGFGQPYALLLGNLSAELTSVGDGVEVAVSDDWILKRSKDKLLTLFRFAYPIRNSTLIEQTDFRGRAWLRRPLDGPVLSPETWNQLIREKLLAGKAHKLKQAVRFAPFSSGLSSALLLGPAPEPSAKHIRIATCYRDRSDLTCNLIRDLASQRFSADRVELVLVNNQSSDSEAFAVRECANTLGRPWHVECVDYNLPYNHSAQNNLAFQSSTADVFVFLNNDVRLSNPTALQTLANHALLPGVASAGPRVVGEGGKLISSGMQLFPRKEVPGLIGLRESDCPVYSSVLRETTGNSFALAAVASDAYRRIGALDEVEFPTQYNDADYALRALKLGYRHLFVGAVEAFHQPGQTEQRKHKDSVREVYHRLLNRHGDLSAFLDVDPIWFPEHHADAYLGPMPRAIKKGASFVLRWAGRASSKLTPFTKAAQIQ